MKRVVFLCLFFCFCSNITAQTQYLSIVSSSPTEQKKIDSIGYSTTHSDAKSILKEVRSFSEKVLESGFIESEIEMNKKINDSTFLYQFRLSQKTNFINIYSSSKFKKLLFKENKSDTVAIVFGEVKNFIKESLAQLEKKGFPLSKIQLINFEKRDKKLYAELQITIEKKRTVDDIVINGYAKFPESHRRQLKRIYRKKVFNQDNLKNVYSDVEKFRFVRQFKYPEILFSTDSTKVFCYVEKSKSNTFDGFIGFSNNDTQNLKVNGYLDLVLNNLLNSGETFSLNWKSDGNDQKTFNASIELPYIFNSPLGLKAQLNIFKQDSTFQNTKTALDLGYFFNYNTRLYLGYQSSESSDIQNQNSFNISDFTNSFVTSQFEFIDFKSDEFLFPEKTKVDFKIGTGTRRSNFGKNDQVFLNFNMKYVFFFNQKNNIQIRSQNYYLNSDTYIINELYRFGGINSIRGFNENSLQADLFTSVLSEYRYIVASNLYVHSIIDYGYYKDQTSKNKGELLGLGLGFGLATKNGLFNIIYANGSVKGQEIKNSNSIVHISFRTQF